MNNQEQKENSFRTLIKDEVFKNNSTNIDLYKKFPNVPKALLKRYRFDMTHQLKEYNRWLDEWREQGIELWKLEIQNKYTSKLKQIMRTSEMNENLYKEMMKNKNFDIILAFLIGMTIASIITKIWN